MQCLTSLCNAKRELEVKVHIIYLIDVNYKLNYKNTLII